MSTKAEPRPSFPWRRLLLGGGVLAPLIVALAVTASVSRASRAATRLQSAIDALDAAEPGWRLEDLEAARPDPPPAENSALVIERVVKALPTSYFGGDLDEQLKSAPPPQRIDKSLRQATADELATIAPAMTDARRLAAMPEGQHALDYSPPPLLMRFDHVAHVRRAMVLLQLDACLLAEAGDQKAALLACRAMLNAARSLGDEPFVLVQHQRNSLVGSALATAERVLAQGEAADADLAEWQAAVSREERHPTGRLRARAACAETHATFVWLEKEPPQANGLKALFLIGNGFEEWQENVFGVSPTFLRLQHATLLELLAGYAEASRLPPHEQAAAEAACDARATSEAERSRWVRTLLPASSRIAAVGRRKLGLSRAMQALLAVERHRLRHGAWPARLEDVPKELLDTVPLDPADGKPLRYKRTADGVVVYSLGENGRDDGGSVGASGSLDDGYRLWDVSQRRQPPKPVAPK